MRTQEFIKWGAIIAILSVQDNGADFLIPVKANHPELEARLPDRTPAVLPPLGRAGRDDPAARPVRYRRKRG